MLFRFKSMVPCRGKVRTLSEDAFKREAGLNPNASATYYMSRISLGKEQLRNMPDKTRMLPGMTLNAEIVVGKRSVMSYLLWPMMKAMDEAIREP